MADKACHVVGSTTQVGLTQALGLALSTFRNEFDDNLQGPWRGTCMPSRR